MNRRQRNAAIVALVIVGMVLAAALFVIYDKPSDEYSGIPTIRPYINDDAGVLLDQDYYDLEDFCYEVELNNSCEIAVLIVETKSGEKTMNHLKSLMLSFSYPEVEGGNRAGTSMQACLMLSTTLLPCPRRVSLPQKCSGFSGTVRFTGKVPWKHGISRGRSISSGRDLNRCNAAGLFEHTEQADERVPTGRHGEYLERREPDGLFPVQGRPVCSREPPDPEVVPTPLRLLPNHM